MSQDLKAQIIEYAHEIGFDQVGFCRAEGKEGMYDQYRQFIAEGRHGTMAWMDKRHEHRASPKSLWPECQSVLMLAMNYNAHPDPLAHLGDPNQAGVSLYARGRDYHDIIKKKLKQLGRWMCQSFDCEVKVFVDTAPVMEKPLAEEAGVGWQGKHTNLVSNQIGSWFFLGAIYTTLKLDVDKPHKDQCGSCTACLEACPTKAFPAPYQLDARRCISYLTIEHDGPVPEEFREALGNRIYGCDDCLAACPWNKFAHEAREARFKTREILENPQLADLVTLDDATFREVFSKSPIKRSGRNRFIRNVLYAIGNSGQADYLPIIAPLGKDASEMVRDAADWATKKLQT
ncbi:tRNA epoxyqueuosine(34) reductase QueG [Temperatibacter marinus]|uniref:Epoxyqueuosine reductase n=1 Tax=Temperatibacter marinus TaxID=1456591 RepID=A0AA52EJ40_9PROT|nr:tRNA epoxyqueuosine(34) reductase QueG [Temperatibacter marinus]WND03462.1 tRNA epoxyqueuosine(34) reductase QueG [Temperatibacter marinus]